MSCDGAEAVFEAANRVEQVRHQQAVDDEAAAIGRGDRLLADRAGIRHQRVVGLLAGRQRANHFDQLHQRHGIEEVQAGDLVGPLGAGAELGDAERRGVRRDDAVRPTTASTCA